MLTSLCLTGALVLAPSAFAQGSFCTTTAASGASVTKCVDAPSPTPSATASPEVTVIDEGTLTASPTATAAASGSVAPVVAAVGGELPDTGGAARLALMAAALLVGSGILSYRIVARSG